VFSRQPIANDKDHDEDYDKDRVPPFLLRSKAVLGEIMNKHCALAGFLWSAVATMPTLAEAAVNKEIRVITADTVHRPYAEGTPRFTVSFAPDYVACDIPRRFYIELEMPQKDCPALDVRHEGCVRLLDKNDFVTQLDSEARDVGRERIVRRFYFETLKRAEKTEIRFRLGQDAVVVPLVIWDFSDLRRFRLVNDVKLPRRYPLHGSLACLKQRQAKPAKPRTGGRPRHLRANSRARFDQDIDVRRFTADEAWIICPDTSAMGSQMEGSPDPIHGNDVYKAGGAHYPYRLIMPTPGNVNSWYAISPVDGRRIPSNDWAAGDYHTGPFIDDGFNGLEYDGRRHHFVAMVGQWRGELSYGLPYIAAENYIRTGDAHCLHLALVGLSRLALEHQFLAAMPHHRKAHGLRHKNLRFVDATPLSKGGNSGLLMTGIGTSAHIGKLYDAYDRVFPYIDDDPGIIPFLRAKGLPIENVEDLKRFLEEGIFLVWTQIALDGQCHVNFPGTENRFLHAISVLDYPITDFVDIAYKGHPGYWSSGFMRQLIGDGIHRDGVKFESPGGYNGLGNLSVLRVFEQMEEYLNRHPGRFPPDKYPRMSMSRRFLTAAESHIEHAPTQYTRIFLGDAGGLPVFGNPVGLKDDKTPTTVPRERWFFGDENAEFFETVYAHYQDPKVAWALLNTDGWRPSRGFPFTREQLQTNAADLPANWRSRGRLLSGPGISLLRSGAGENERCLYSQYGVLTHAGESEMGLFLDAFQTRLITPWGYPKNWEHWYRTWCTNNAGRHFPIVENPAKVRHFVRDWNAVRISGVNELNYDAGSIHVSDVRADWLYDQKRWLDTLSPDESRYRVLDDGWQRRVQVLVDVSDREFYVLDFYRIEGGKDHWRTLNTLDGPCEVRGVQLTKQATGTLAGPDVDYYDKEWIKQHGGDRLALGFTHLYNVHKGRAGDEPWTATWKVNDSEGLKIRLTAIESQNAEINLCDARDPSNSVSTVRKFIVWHHDGNGGQKLKSQVLSALDAYWEHPVIQGATSLKVEGKDERGYAPAGCEIFLKERRDYFILSADADEEKEMALPDGTRLKLKGRIGYLSLSPDGEVLNMAMLGGTRLDYGDQAITRSAASYRATIASADYDDWSITLTPAHHTPEELVGKHLYVQRGGRLIGFEARRAERTDDGLKVTLNCDPLMYAATIRGHQDGWLKFRLRPAHSLTVRLSFNRTYHGASVIGRRGTRYLVDTVTPDGVRLRGEGIDMAQVAKDFPVGSTVNVYDYAAGDTVEVPLGASSKRAHGPR